MTDQASLPNPSLDCASLVDPMIGCIGFTHQQKEIHLIPLIPSYSLLKPLIFGVRKE